ncbi:Alpha/Beta hydrolase protein [Phycomyces nitens]|nr:Alpha/Beta hydrolase protein [Phycomyces nitens]
MAQVKPFGSWPSPITAESLASVSPLIDICVDQTTNSVFWCQVMSSEKGRTQIFQRPLDASAPPKALLPLEYNCRTRVHEYGQGALMVKNGLLIFSNDADCRLYKIDLVNAPDTIVAITPESEWFRYADIVLDEKLRYLVCVREEHFENEQPKDVVNTLVAISLEEKDLSKAVKVIVEGADFYSTPRISPDGKTLAYVDWVHPNMPWDYTRLHTAKISYSEGECSLSSTKTVAGDTIEESIVQPEFGIDNVLYFASDRSGFWNLYRYKDTVELLLDKPISQDFAGPPWRFNNSYYTPFSSDPTKLLCINKDSLAVLNTSEKTLTNLALEFTHFNQLRTYSGACPETVVVNAASTVQPSQLISYSLVDQSLLHVLKESSAPKLDADYISVGKEITFLTTDNKEAYCYFYEPKHPEYIGKGKPPLRVLSHGGPTAESPNSYSRDIQYWTTRGFAIADVNYGGSSGYGREYRNRLKKQWGVVDVDDCCNAALYLAKEGLVDQEKLAIVGSSAGGFTTLASVAFRDVFKAGCCMYGISDITLLAKETHKFESRYPDQLIGEYPKDKAIYEERSPLFSADNIKCPVIFFQGSEDKVVPPSQSEVMVEALKKKGIPVAYVLYQGETHGFRLAENIKRTKELEQWFYGQIFGFPVPDVQGVEIYNFHK